MCPGNSDDVCAKMEHGRVVLLSYGIAIEAPAFVDLTNLHTLENVGIAAGGVVARRFGRVGWFGRLCRGALVVGGHIVL